MCSCFWHGTRLVSHQGGDPGVASSCQEGFVVEGLGGKKLYFPGEAALEVLNPLPIPTRIFLMYQSLVLAPQHKHQLSEPVAVPWVLPLELLSGSFSPQQPLRHPAQSGWKVSGCPLGQLSSFPCQLQLSGRRQWEGFSSRRNNESFSQVGGVRTQLSLLCFVLCLLSWDS